MKKCSICIEEKSHKFFYPNKGRKDGLSVYCISCTKEYEKNNKSKRLAEKRHYYSQNEPILKERSKKNYRKDLAKNLLYNSKRRAIKKDLPFNIDISDIVIPEFCPVLGIKLGINNGKSMDNSPSLDKIIPAKGYVKGNVVVVSMKANQIKTNATIQEIKAVYEFYKEKMI